MENKIKIVYIDDNIDPAISKYLHKYSELDENYDYEEIEFNTNEGYEKLLNSNYIKTSNIIIIDSKLFENSQVSLKKFTGEEFIIMLKKIFPFIEAILISQNEAEEGIDCVPKYKEEYNYSIDEYYKEHLGPSISIAVNKINMNRKLLNKLKNNTDIDEFLVEQIINTMQGSISYEHLKVEDIDRIIDSFQKLQRSVDNE